MKTLFTAVTALLFSCATMFAAPAIEPLEEGQYKISVGEVSMIVDAAHGGKILSFKYGDAEAISQIQMPNAFGSTFWTSPQKEWNWPPVPEYDTMPFTATEDGGVLRLHGPVSERFKYSISKEFATDPSDNSILVTYTITNEGDTERSVAPWEITRVPNAGMVIFQAPFESITPAGLLPFKEQNGIAIYEADTAPQNRKVNANGKGWYTFINHGLMLMKRFQDLEEGQEAPGEAEIQVYVNVGKTFMELECQGPYTSLKRESQCTGRLNGTLFHRQAQVPEHSRAEPLDRDLRAHRARGRKVHPVRDPRARRVDSRAVSLEDSRAERLRGSSKNS